jgi:prepilin-type N-terminal cleavage/methylation domain-containing protein
MKAAPPTDAGPRGRARPTPGRRPREHGFTLIELLIVIIIVGILAAIAIPMYIGQRDKAKEATLKTTAHYVLIATEDYAGSDLIITPYHGFENTAALEAVAAKTWVSSALEVSIKKASGVNRDGVYTNPYSGKKAVLNTSITYLTSAGYAQYVAPAVFITNEPSCRYGSIQGAANATLRTYLRGTVIACWNNQNGVNAIEVYYLDGDGVRSDTVARVPFN